LDRIEFGMPTLLELKNIEECAALAGALGLSFVEINMNMPQYQIERLDAKALRRLAAGGLYFTFHLDENFNPSDFNRLVARAYIETAVATVRLAREIGAPVVNLHLAEGIYFSLPGRKAYLFDVYRDQYLKGLTDFRNACREVAGDEVTLSVENTSGFLPFMREGLELLLDCPCFSLTLDVGHGHAASGADEAFFLEHRERLSHIHLHDAVGESCHLALGRGEIDLPEKLSLAAARGCRCVVETKTADALRASVEWLKDGRYL
jgi:sugar phosphate isomerase/epimerase